MPSRILEDLARLPTRPDEDRILRAHGRKSLQAEILEEMANAMARAERKVHTALAALTDAQEALDNGDGPMRRRRERFATTWEKARLARWELVVQREAMGLRFSDNIREIYPLPPRPTWLEVDGEVRFG